MNPLNSIVKPKAALIIKTLWFIIPLLVCGTWFIAKKYFADQNHEMMQNKALIQNDKDHVTILCLVNELKNTVDTIKKNDKDFKQTLDILVKNEKLLTNAHIDLISNIKINQEFYKKTLYQLAPLLNYYQPKSIDVLGVTDTIKKKISYQFIK